MRAKDRQETQALLQQVLEKNQRSRTAQELTKKFNQTGTLSKRDLKILRSLLARHSQAA